MRLLRAVTTGSFLGLTLVAAAGARPVDPDPDLPPPASGGAITVPCRLHESCDTAATKRLVLGAVARPAVQRPPTATAPRTVVRPGTLVPGQIRFPARR